MSKFSGKFALMKRNFEPRRNLYENVSENVPVDRTRYKIVHKMVERGKPLLTKTSSKCIME